jgi:hypothetical protein
LFRKLTSCVPIPGFFQGPPLRSTSLKEVVDNLGRFEVQGKREDLVLHQLTGIFFVRLGLVPERIPGK